MELNQIKSINDAMSFLSILDDLSVEQIKDVTARLLKDMKSANVDYNIIEHFKIITSMRF